MSEIARLVSDHFDIWTPARERKNGAGRGGGKRGSIYGIERLRALILDLALRGKLLPQDASDEAAPASLVRARKSLAEKANGVRRLRWKPSRSFDDHEIDKPLPPGWTLARVNDTGFYINGLAFQPSDWSDTGRPIIRIQNLTNANTPYNYAQGDYPDDVVVRDGDLLVSWSATLAAFQWSGEDAILNQHIFRVIHEPALTERAFLRLMLEHAIGEMADGDHAHGLVMTHINRGPFLDHLVKVPPLAEQRRIVAKVDELTALCDALEGESAAALAAHQTLVETLLATLANSADAAELAANWTRLEAHFDTVFITEAGVDALKQTILELAVRGRLVSNLGEVKPGTLDDVGDWVGGNGFPKQFQGNQEGEFAFLKVSDMNLPGNERQIAVSNNWVSANALRAMRARAHPIGTIIFPKIGGAIATNKRRILAVPAAIDNNCAGQIPRQDIDVDWLFMVLSSIDMTAYQAGTSVPALNMKRLGKHPVAIPSIEAQREIVAKVDALLALCDGLKSRITDAGQIQVRLADAIVERAAA